MRVVSITHPIIEDLPETLRSPEGIIAYLARVSSPNQENPEYAKLIKYLIRNKHWSPFEMVDMTVEIITTRAIAAQLLRHKSFSFQEFSLRFAEMFYGCEVVEARRQDPKNRQNSIDDLPQDTKDWFTEVQKELYDCIELAYKEALSRGIAKEQARFLLPLSTRTKLYMKGNIRSWIHYIELRQANGTQKEHQRIALEVKELFKAHFPIISEALEWQSVV